MSAPGHPDPVRVVVIEEEVVGDGGPRAVAYAVRHNDGWVRASAHASAIVEILSRGPGVVFRRRVTLWLAPGAELERVTTAPAPRAATALDHLTRGLRGAGRRRSSARLHVTPSGELEPAPTASTK